MNNQINDQIREYLSRIGKKGGEAVKRKYGVEYFKEIRKKVRHPGRKRKKPNWKEFAQEF